MAVKGILATVDDIEGGDQPLSVPSTSVRDAQEAEFAKIGPLPDSGPSRWVRRMPVESPISTTIFGVLRG